MATFKINPKNNVDVDKKPRVYFTCHPEDFDKYFSRVCEDLFKTQDCAVYYTADMTAPLDREEKELDLGRSNLVVVPVTLKLLTTPNRAMDDDIPYALAEHIPVLPILMDPGLDDLYSAPDKFGSLQYLSAISTDPTEISYEEKLEKYLETVLISDELAQGIRAAFDAYIFLSYRKKDRRYANELMRMIHRIPQCRDIAIWFDEFLTPGESFKESIDRILGDSKLFALLVTPNLLEEPGGKPNFVMGQEYPAARATGIDILPAEMEKTDGKTLKAKFEGLPKCVDPHDERRFRERLLKTLKKLALEENNEPAHQFLIGLAYLDGIDVEVDRGRGLELITRAAQAGLDEAMEKLFSMYYHGHRVGVDYRQAALWARRLAEHRQERLGAEDPETLDALNDLAAACVAAGDYREGVQISRRIYGIYCDGHMQSHPDAVRALVNMAYYGSLVDRDEQTLEDLRKAYDHCRQYLGEDRPVTLTALNNLALGHNALGQHTEALQLQQKAYTLSCDLLGPEHAYSLIMQNNIASSHIYMEEYQKALQLLEENYATKCRVLGEEHPETLTAQHNLGCCCNHLEEYERAAALLQNVYQRRCKLLGEKHPLTLISLNVLANTMLCLGETEKGMDMVERVYMHRCEALGPEHPDTENSRKDLAALCDWLEDEEAVLAIKQRLFDFHCGFFGEKHPAVLEALHELALLYYGYEDYSQAAALLEKLYMLRCQVLGEKDPETLTALYQWAATCADLEDTEKELQLHKKAAELRLEVLGPEHPDTLMSLGDLAFAYGKVMNYKQKRKLEEKAYAGCCKVFGPEDPKTLRILNNLSFTYGELGNHKKALELSTLAYDLYCKTGLGEDPEAINALNNMATYSGLMGDNEQEIQLQERAYAIRCKVLGQDHPDTLLSLYNLSVAYHNSGNILRSLELEYRYSCAVNGPYRTATLNIMSKWAAYCGHFGEYRKQLELAEELYDISCRLFGKEHPQALQFRAYADDVRKKLQE